MPTIEPWGPSVRTGLARGTPGRPTHEPTIPPANATIKNNAPRNKLFQFMDLLTACGPQRATKYSIYEALIRFRPRSVSAWAPNPAPPTAAETKYA